MITELVAWFGLHRVIYDNLLQEWKSQEDDINSFEVDCAEKELTVGRDGKLFLDPADELFLDNGGMFGGRTIILNRAEAWEFKVKGPRNTRPLAIQQVIDHLQGMETPIRLSLVYRGGWPDDTILEQAEQFFDHGISSDPDEMAQWISDYLERNEVRITRKQCDWIVEHVGMDKQQLVEMVVSLANSKEKVTSESIERVANKMGAVEGYRIMRAITDGNRSQAAEIFERIANRGMDIIPLNAMLTNRFRYICMATDPNAELGNLAGNPRSHFAIMKEARRLGPQRAAKCLSILAENDYNIKGMGNLDPVLSTRLSIDRLAKICRV